MKDGFKIQDLSVIVDALLTNDRLTFGTLVNEQTGAVLNAIRRATDRGLKFAIIPRRTGGYRVEVNGSIHRFHNDGVHNADDFTAANLLTALDRFVTDYGIGPFTSRLNNVEFGVNIRLSFPATRILNNLVSYKNQPFRRETENGTTYYQCKTQRYVLKIYDKGTQYDMGNNLLRVEVKVLKMAYLTRQGIHLDTLADLLTVSNYGLLGALLADAFAAVVVDDPTINPNTLTEKERSIYENGRNPRFWQMPDNLRPAQATAHRQRLHRTERSYRALLGRYGQENWQTQITTLIREKWAQLTHVDDQLLNDIEERRTAWKNNVKITWPGEECSEDIAPETPQKRHELTEGNQGVYCEGSAENTQKERHELTGGIAGVYCYEPAMNRPELTDPLGQGMSQINPLNLGLERDTPLVPASTGPGSIICPITGVPIPATARAGRGVRRFISAAMLRANDDLLMRLNGRFTQYTKGSKEDDYSRAAHNVRNAHSNPRNNLRRRIDRIYQQPVLFDVEGTLRLTPDQRASLDYWQGTPYEVRLPADHVA